jgi:hypothetical protein
VLLAMDAAPGFRTNAMRIAATHLYGFNFMNNCEIVPPTSLYDFLNICLVAAHYGINDLLESTLKAADHALLVCLDHEDNDDAEYSLKDFLGERLVTPSEDRYLPRLFSILGPHLKNLHTKPHFQDLLDHEPKVVRYLLKELVRDQALRGNSDL